MPVLGTPLMTLVSSILSANQDGGLWIFTGIAFLISVFVLVFTIWAFLPINKYILGSTSYEDPGLLKKLVAKWVRFDYLRIFLIGIGLAASIVALHSYYQIY